jgi:hypothetical protein
MNRHNRHGCHKTEGADPYNMESPTQRDACDDCDDEMPNSQFAICGNVALELGKGKSQIKKEEKMKNGAHDVQRLAKFAVNQILPSKVKMDADLERLPKVRLSRALERAAAAVVVFDKQRVIQEITAQSEPGPFKFSVLQRSTGDFRDSVMRAKESEELLCLMLPEGAWFLDSDDLPAAMKLLGLVSAARRNSAK